MTEVYGRANSVNVQKVLWCPDELEVPFERYDVGGLYGGNKEPDFLKRNPTGLVPTISDGGLDLWESNAIVRYLAVRHGSGSLWPEDPAARALADKWMDYQLGTIPPVWNVALLRLVCTPPENRDPGAIAASARATAENFAIVYAYLEVREYVAGSSLTVGNIATRPTVYRWLNLEIIDPGCRTWRYGTNGSWASRLPKERSACNHPGELTSSNEFSEEPRKRVEPKPAPAAPGAGSPEGSRGFRGRTLRHTP